MSSLEEPHNVLQFCWGTKRGVGGSKKDIRFYESFTYDNVSYSLYDCVYLFKKDEQQAYIGKIVKIWEQQDQKKKVKILWFFRPDDIQNYLGDSVTSENEIFLACGEGVGLTNINPLEAIAGKCSVICTSTDNRNPKPSKDALKMADYIFYRTFDVGSFAISETLPDSIATVEVKYLLNRKEDQNQVPVSKAEASETQRDVKTDVQSVSLVALESKPKIDELNCTPSETKNNGTEKKHPNGGKHLFDQKSIPNSKDDSLEGVREAKPVVLHVEEKNKSAKSRAPSSVCDDKPTKKMRLSDSSIKQSEKLLPNKNVTGASTLKISTVENGPSGNSVQLHKGSPYKIKLSEKKTKPCDESQQKLSPPARVEDYTKAKHLSLEVTRRPIPNTKKWFKELPWEGKMQNANKQETLVLLENLDHSITATDIEDVMYDTFNENCTVKIMAESTFRNPHYGQAYAIFRTKNAADMVVQKINTRCLMLPNGRPLIASKGMLKMPTTTKSSTFPGHLTIDKIKILMQREEMRRAVSTSHCSQPNTIEYEMAMEWVLSQEKFVKCFNQLFQGHGDESGQVRKNLKTK